MSEERLAYEPELRYAIEIINCRVSELPERLTRLEQGYVQSKSGRHYIREVLSLIHAGSLHTVDDEQLKAFLVVFRLTEVLVVFRLTEVLDARIEHTVGEIPFRYRLEDKVKVKGAGEELSGTVVDRADKLDSNEALYRIRYLNRDGDLTEGWWGKSDLEPAA
jgi:hypothetical protein